MRGRLLGVLVVFLALASGAGAHLPEFSGPRLGQTDEAQVRLAVGLLARAISDGDARRIAESTVTRRPAECDSLKGAVQDLIEPLRSEGLRLIPGFSVEKVTIERDAATVECSARPILVRRSDRTITECERTTERIAFVKESGVWKLASQGWLLDWLRRIGDAREAER